MASPLVAPPSCQLTPQPHTRRSTRRRTTTAQRVYGKRMQEAAKAVIEQKGPTKDADAAEVIGFESTIQDVEARLAQVSLEDDQPKCTPRRAQPRPRVDPEPTSVGIEGTEEVGQRRRSIMTPNRPLKKRAEVMVEVRICSKSDLASPEGQSDSNPPPQSEKSNARQKHGTKTSGRRSSGSISDNKSNAYVAGILHEALSPLASRGVQKFASWAARTSKMFNVVKLAEGSYGEVYKLRLRDDMCKESMSRSKLAKLRSYGDGVFKIVPLRAQSGPGSKKFTTVDEIVSEVKMLKYLDPIPGFARFREVHVVQGRFPEPFQNAWLHYKQTKDDCLNPNPSSKRAYPDSQLWAILEMDDAGSELEKFTWSSIFQIYDIFWGVAMALARAEEYALFEHRDLHLGNVCIRSTRPDGRMDPPSEAEVAAFKKPSGFGISTIETTIIDYSLSRAELRLGNGPNETSEFVSSDLDRKQIFDAIGRDEDEILLRDTYRHMRATLYHGNPLQTEKTPDIPGIWSEYAPRTNLVWLRFLLKNLLKNRKPEERLEQQLQQRRHPLQECSTNKKSQDWKKPKECDGEKVQTARADGCASLVARHLTSDLRTQVNLFRTILEDRLQTVLEMLDLEHGDEDMCCAADLVAYAIDSQWLDEEDFFQACG